MSKEHSDKSVTCCFCKDTTHNSCIKYCANCSAPYCDTCIGCDCLKYCTDCNNLFCDRCCYRMPEMRCTSCMEKRENKYKKQIHEIKKFKIYLIENTISKLFNTYVKPFM